MSAELRVGGTYFVLVFEDEAFTRPVVETYEFLRREPAPDGGASDETGYVFRIIGSDDELFISETQIWQALGINELIERLTEFRDGKIK